MIFLLKSLKMKIIFASIFLLLSIFLTSCQEKASQSNCLPQSELGMSTNIIGGEFKFGEVRFYQDEGPTSKHYVDGFSIDNTEVTNFQFKKFVDETGYKTAAELGYSEKDFPGIPPEYRVPGSMVFIPPTSDEPTSPMAWWKFVAGANWRHPQGPNSNILGKDNFPVVQITYTDALAYAEWIGRRLPTEMEWEFAARGGLDGAIYSWGDESPGKGKLKANTWQGIFPYDNLAEDGFKDSAPAGCFDPNGLGLYDVTGNVWEWTSTPYGPDRNRDYGTNGFDPQQPGIAVNTIKGGSYLCADNYCQRYRPAARQAQDKLMASSHIGFRTVGEIKNN